MTDEGKYLVKKCEKCGTTQKNSNTRCVNCDAVLGAPLTKAEEEAVSSEIARRITDLSDRTDLFYVSPFRRAIGMISAVTAALCIIWYFLIYNITGDSRDYILGPLEALFCFAFTAFELLFPEQAWKLSRFGDLWKYDADLSPSDFWISLGRGLSYLFFGLGWLGIVFALLRLFEII